MSLFNDLCLLKLFLADLLVQRPDSNRSLLMFESLLPPLVESPLIGPGTIFFIIRHGIYGLGFCSLFQNPRAAAGSFTYGCTSAGLRPENSGKHLQGATQMVAMVSSSCSGTMTQAFIRTLKKHAQLPNWAQVTILMEMKLVLHSSEAIHAKTTSEIILLSYQSLFIYCLIFLEHNSLAEHVMFFLHFTEFSHFGHEPDTLCVCDTGNNITNLSTTLQSPNACTAERFWWSFFFCVCGY